MEMDAILTLLVLVGAVTLFVTEKLPVDVVAMLVLASLLVLGLVTPVEALSGFSSEATITVAANTPAGIYTVAYAICEILNPTNCANTVETVTVSAAAIVALPETYPAINGLTGGVTTTVCIASAGWARKPALCWPLSSPAIISAA